ncbi:MAG: glycoside hydrolase family 130 protein [Mycobacteriales bacterium]
MQRQQVRSPAVHRTDVVLTPDSQRVLGRPHVPGDDPAAEGEPRLAGIVQRVLRLSGDEVRAELADVERRFRSRHRVLDTMLSRNAERVAHLLGDSDDDRRRLVGAYLTQEHAFQAAALTNPSMVRAPDQTGVPAGSCRFLLSLRAIGEGHISSITFQTGTVDEHGGVAIEKVGPHAETGERRGAVYERTHFADKLLELGADLSCTTPVLECLTEEFDSAALESAIAVLDDQPRALVHESVQLMRWLAASNYLLDFDPAATALYERLIWPEGPFESRGMEDARFVRFGYEDGSTTYYATYTAYDGFQILPQLIETSDFACFKISTLAGRSAQNKGMALFPRRIDGNYVALSRPDRENIHLLRSPDPRSWQTPSHVLRRPQHAWEAIQMGNCGSPLETEHGWLVLTHGVGAMRTYRLGAMLLDLEHPERIIADLPEPILEASPEERDGYVPNVVYSCGGMLHGDHLVLPYGASDQQTRIATVPVAELLEALLAHPVSP